MAGPLHCEQGQQSEEATIVPIAALVTPSCQFQFTSADGLAIACARWDARGLVRGVVQIAHGMGEHIGRYGGVIEGLVESGLIVYGNDHRGHGRTAPYPQAFGDFFEFHRPAVGGGYVSPDADRKEGEPQEAADLAGA